MKESGSQPCPHWVCVPPRGSSLMKREEPVHTMCSLFSSPGALARPWGRSSGHDLVPALRAPGPEPWGGPGWRDTHKVEWQPEQKAGSGLGEQAACAHSFPRGTGVTWPPQCGDSAKCCRHSTSGCGLTMPSLVMPASASPCRWSCWAVRQVQAGREAGGLGAGRGGRQGPSAIPHQCPRWWRPRARGLSTAVPAARVP